MAGAEVDAGTALFVGGFVAVICWFAALLTWFAGGGTRVVTGLALALVALGCVFGLLGVGAALLVGQSS
jgi:hypothetical protein